MEPVSKQVVLVDIDMLMDTRLAILGDMNFKWVETHLNGKYRYRLSDHWGDLGEGIDQEAYDAAYANRDNLTLSRARLTNMVGMLSGLVRSYEDEIMSGHSQLREIIVVINFYPYELSDEEKHRFLQCLTEFIGSIATLRAVDEPPEALSITYMKYKGYTQLVLYDFNQWLNIHYAKYDKYENMPKDQAFVVVAPRRKATKFDPKLYEDMKANNVHTQDEFELAEGMLATLFRMTYIPISYASIFDPDADYSDITEE